MKNKNKNKIKNKNDFLVLFSSLFSFSFLFLILLSNCFYIFVNSTWPRDAIDGKLSLDWPRKCQRVFVDYTWPKGTIDGQLSLTWAKSGTEFSIANWNVVPSLIGICRIQRWCSLFSFLTGDTLFGKIWSKI